MFKYTNQMGSTKVNNQNEQLYRTEKNLIKNAKQVPL